MICSKVIGSISIQRAFHYVFRPHFEENNNNNKPKNKQKNPKPVKNNQIHKQFPFFCVFLHINLFAVTMQLIDFKQMASLPCDVRFMKVKPVQFLHAQAVL